MGLFRKTKQQKIEKYREGIRCNFVIGETVGSNYSAGTRMAATAAFGIVGLAATSGTGVQEIKVIGRIRLAPKGVVLYSKDIGELRIPYSDIVRCEKSLISGKGIILTSGEKIKAAPYDIEIFDIINERACGQVEAGW